jgi:hypothetical protein
VTLKIYWSTICYLTMVLLPFCAPELLLLGGNTFKGDLSMICLSSSMENLPTIASDCGGTDPILNCSCCTICCNDGNNECDDLAWEGNLDPQMEYDYKRGGENVFHGAIFDGSGL